MGWLLFAMLGIPGATLLLISTVTLPGFLISLAILSFVAGWALLLARKPLRSLPRLLGCTSLTVGTLLIGTVWNKAPRPRTDSESFNALVPGVSSNDDGTARFHSWSPSSLVPEIDQQLMGARLVAWMDPLIDAPMAKRLRDLNRRVYEEMKRDAGFRNLPSSLGICYTEMFARRAPTGHRFVYLPKQAASSKESPLPVILFLHGSLGNFQGYLWVWKRLADANGFAIVAPSHGVGEWRNDGGLAEIRTALEFCRSQPSFDATRIYLAGLSNGGAGITHAIPHLSDAFAGFIYLSPVIDPAKLAQPSLGDSLRGTPVLVVTGANDNRVPADYVASGVENLKSQGAEVTFHVIPDEDHFLIYSQPDEVMTRVDEWLARTAGPVKMRTVNARKAEAESMRLHPTPPGPD